MEGFDVIFCVISIIFFSRSLAADKAFMQNKDPSLFPAVKSKGNVAKVFFVITCIRFGMSAVGIIGFAEMFSMGQDSFFNNLGSVVSVFIISLLVNVATLIMGIIAISKYNEAQKAYTAIAPKPNGATGGYNAAAPFGNTANNNGANYANPANTGYNAGNTGYNTNNTGAQSSYQVNAHTNDPTQLRSATGDQSPFEAPPPNYTKYNYGNTANYQRGITFPIQNNPQGSSPQNVQQGAPMRSEGSTPSYGPPPNSSSSNVNNSAAVNNAKPRQYVSQMPEVTPLPASKPSTSTNAPANTASAPQKPVVPVILPVAPEIKREATVRCKHCGVTNKEGDKFCTFCGRSLSE